MVFQLTDTQIELRNACASQARHILAYGGSRSGKTFGFCYAIAVRVLSAPTSRHLIARLHNIDVRQAVMMDTWPSMMKKAFPDVKYELNRSDQFAQFENESEVWFLGLDDKERIEKILGKEFATIFQGECSQIPYTTVTTVRTRLAQNVKKLNGEPLRLKGYYDLNPVGRSHWTHKEFIEGVRPENGLPLRPGSRAYVILNPDKNPHLPKEYMEELNELPERQRRRFLEGKYLDETPGTLWPIDRIDSCRVAEAPQLTRIIVAVDPSGSDGSTGDSQGIIAVGLGVDGHAYVLKDRTCCLSPGGWASQAVRLYHELEANKMVAERNFGGAMVEHTIRTVDPNINVKLVTASRGKHVRAEPVAALYEARKDVPQKVHHVGKFPELEDEMAMTTTEGYQGSGSPNRMDALVWALTELMLKKKVTYPGYIGG